MTPTTALIEPGFALEGPAFTVSHATIKAFARSVMDFNPLHLDDGFMRDTRFGKTQFEGVIMHGQTAYGLVTRMFTDWAAEVEGELRRVELRFLKPVHPGNTITPSATVQLSKDTTTSHWLVFDVSVTNQDGVLTARGEAQVELFGRRSR